MKMKTVAILSFASLVLVCVTETYSTEARAEFKIKTPIVEPDEAEVEHAGSYGFDRRPGHNNEQSEVGSIGYGFTKNWAVELEGEWGRDAGPGNPSQFKAVNLGNKIQVFDQGEKAVDFGLWAEIGLAAQGGNPDDLKFGPLVQKSFGKTTATANLFIDKQIGENAEGGTDLNYGLQLKYDWKKLISPALEMYGDFGTATRTHNDNIQQHRLGPVLLGTISFERMGALKYELGYLNGITGQTPASTIKWGLEYEFTF